MVHGMTLKKWIGIGLILLSGVWFACIFVTPFLNLAVEIKAILGVSFLVLMEASFWLGSLIVGKQIVSRYWLSIKRHLGLGSKSNAGLTDTPLEGTLKAPAAGKVRWTEGKAFVILVENIPYAAMVLIGSAIFLLGFGFTFAGWLSAALYATYGVIGTLWIIVFVCPYCPNFGSACFSGHGEISAMFMQKKDQHKFASEFKKNIPVIIPIYAIPMLAGIAFFGLSLSYLVLLCAIVFAVNSYALAPLVSKKFACSKCSVKDECPWMGNSAAKKHVS
jgi:hypothetical protein